MSKVKAPKPNPSSTLDDLIQPKYEDMKLILDKIKNNHPDKLLTAEDVVKEAANPSSPLHDYPGFLWDDDQEAAHKYRLSVARQLIRQITIVYKESPVKPLPKYVSLVQDRQRPGGGYREIKEVICSTQLLQQLEDTAKKDIEGVLRRYEILKDFCAKIRATLNQS